MSEQHSDALAQLIRAVKARIDAIGIDAPRDYEVDPNKHYDYDMEEAAALNELRWILARLEQSR